MLENNNYNAIVIGKVVGIHIDDDFITGGKIDVEKIQPLARLGYFDYASLGEIFPIKRPE